MIVTTLREIIFSMQSGQRVSKIILKSSPDMLCTNLMCEKVTLPCMCKLEATLNKINLDYCTLLDLSGNNMTSLPNNISRMKNLNELHIQNNLLVSIDDTLFENMTDLKLINVTGNPLQRIPENLKKLCIF